MLLAAQFEAKFTLSIRTSGLVLSRTNTLHGTDVGCTYATYIGPLN